MGQVEAVALAPKNRSRARCSPAWLILRNGAGGEISHRHRRRCGALFGPRCNDRVHRRECGGGGIGMVEIGTELAMRSPSVVLSCCM